MPVRQQTQAVSQFTCLGSECPDTCCKGWGMQLTEETVEKYRQEAPELLDAVASGEADFIMKRDPVTDYCVKFDNGLCSIHRDYGEAFLGDACHFYPRITRALGDTVFTTAALSCPEAARLMLYEKDGFTLTPRTEIRVPYSLKNYLPEGMTPGEAMALHQLFIAEAGNGAHTAERNLMRVGVVARALETQDKKMWPQAAGFYFTMADGRLPPPEAEATDLHKLLNALQGLIAASKATSRPRLMEVVQQMAAGVGAEMDWERNGIAMTADAPQRILKLLRHWRAQAPAMQPLLRRYLQAQLSQALFPFSGLGHTLSERMTIIGVRFATVKLALMCAMVGGALKEADIIRIIHSLSRFLDHLAEPELSLAIYKETGWVREARLRALIGDETS